MAKRLKSKLKFWRVSNFGGLLNSHVGMVVGVGWWNLTGLISGEWVTKGGRCQEFQFEVEWRSMGKETLLSKREINGGAFHGVKWVLHASRLMCVCYDTRHLPALWDIFGGQVCGGRCEL
uniref:Uncharacterized protein n=1 Tax=Nelumbo nucifera TaxID=4432 RepID=A0A822Z3X8_NELNU|nr:TPA_asm: hypothetical protein HUJ06_013672 [Nelumbo nucifera]